MRITYLISRYGSGAISNRPHAELLAEWQKLGAEVSVLTLSAGDDPPGSTVVDGVPVQRLPADRGSLDRALKPLSATALHYRYFLPLLPRYALALPQHRPDIIHVEGAYPHGVIAALAAPNIPIALTLQGADVMSEPAYDYGYGRFARVRAMLRWAFERSALVRGDSVQIRDLAVRLGCPPEKAIAIPYNITWGNYLPAGTEAAFRAEARQQIAAKLGIAPDAPLVLSLGRLHPFKGVEYLIRAVPAILQAVPDAQIIVGGPSRQTPRFGDYGAYLANLAAELGVAHAVHFIGAVPYDDARAYFAAADVLVIPSVVEAFNRVLVEAAAVGTPAVVTSTTGVADYAGAAGSAIVVPPEAAEPIAMGVVTILTDRAAAAAMQERALRFAQDFTPRTMAEQILDQYRHVLATPSTRSS